LFVDVESERTLLQPKLYAESILYALKAKSIAEGLNSAIFYN